MNPEEYGNQWLVTVHDWIKRTDPSGRLLMPVSLLISCPNETSKTIWSQ